MPRKKEPLVDFVRRTEIKPGEDVFELVHRVALEPGDLSQVVRTKVAVIRAATFFDLVGLPKKEQAAKLEQLLQVRAKRRG